jgi:hypothetical protein
LAASSVSHVALLEASVVLLSEALKKTKNRMETPGKKVYRWQDVIKWQDVIYVDASGSSFDWAPHEDNVPRLIRVPIHKDGSVDDFKECICQLHHDSIKVLALTR